MQWLLALAFSILFGTLASAADGSFPLVQEVVQKVLARDEATTEGLTHYEYHQKVRTERLKSDGTVRDGSDLEMTVRPGDDFTVTVDGKGGVLAPTQVTDQQRKAARDSEKLKANFTLRKLAPRFDIALAGQETVGGQPVYVLAFSPKKDPQPYNSRIEKILNNLTGKIWVSIDDYSIVQTKAQLASPVGMAWVFATMKELNFLFRSQPVGESDPGLRVPVEFDIDYRVGVIMGEVRQRQRISMDGYVRR